MADTEPSPTNSNKRNSKRLSVSFSLEEAKAVPIARIMELEVTGDSVDKLLKLIGSEATRKEPGCLRSDVFQDQQNPCLFMMYEVFDSAKAMDAHLQKPYVKELEEYLQGQATTIVSKATTVSDAIIFQPGRCPKPEKPPIAQLIDVEIKEQYAEKFVTLMTANAIGSRTEDGCLHCDVLRNQDNPCKFTIYTVFASQKDIDGRSNMDYVKDWVAFEKDETQPVIAKLLKQLDAIDFQAEEKKPSIARAASNLSVPPSVIPPVGDEVQASMGSSSLGLTKSQNLWKNIKLAAAPSVASAQAADGEEAQAAMNAQKSANMWKKLKVEVGVTELDEEGNEVPKPKEVKSIADVVKLAKAQNMLERKTTLERLMEEAEKDKDPVRRFVSSRSYDFIIAPLIIFNVILVGIDIDMKIKSEAEVNFWIFIHTLWNFVWMAEMLLRMYCMGASQVEAPKKLRKIQEKLKLKKTIESYTSPDYFKSGFNRLDIFLVFTSIVDTWCLPFMGPALAEWALSVRVLRTLRLIRFIRMFENLWLIVDGFIRSWNSLCWTLLMLFFMTYSGAVYLTLTVGHRCPFEYNVWSDCDPFFGRLVRSTWTLVQVISGDSWSSGIAKPMIEVKPFLMVFFLATLFIGIFGMLNIIIGIIVESMVEAKQEMQNEKQKSSIVGQMETIQKIFLLSDEDGSGEIDFQEFSDGLKDQHMVDMFESMHIPVEDDPLAIFDMLDTKHKDTITINQFMDGILKIQTPPTNIDVYSSTKLAFSKAYHRKGIDGTDAPKDPGSSNKASEEPSQGLDTSGDANANLLNGIQQACRGMQNMRMGLEAMRGAKA